MLAVTWLLNWRIMPTKTSVGVVARGTGFFFTTTGAAVGLGAAAIKLKLEEFMDSLGASLLLLLPMTLDVVVEAAGMDGFLF